MLELIAKAGTTRVPFDGKRFVFGRDDACDHTITGDRLVSRRHCEVLRDTKHVVLRDLGSRNGTRVRGQPIEAVRLADGAVFQVGEMFVRFFASAESAAGVPEAAYPSALAAKPAPTPAPPPRDDDTLQLADDGDDEPVYDVAVLVEDDNGAASPDLQVTPESGAKTSGGIVDMARMGRDPGFGIEALSLLNARGQVVHAAGAELTHATESLGHLQLLTLGALRSNASDIHLEPKQHDTLIRVRVDGTMLEVARLTADQSTKLMSLIKVLCDIDISRKSVIQEGHFSMAVPGRTIDYRVSFAPAMYGQKMVVRVLDSAQAPQQLTDLDMPPEIETALREVSQRSTGTLLVCGPTGSGKTTTLYAVLRQIDAGQRNVITIEDPIEYELRGVTQIPVDTQEGHTFGNLLRTCLRQDPDVIVLGEVRDKDTSVTSMQAATTGHLVLSTIHANDTVSTVLRLLDLGVEPYLIASTLNVVLAQRLVRRLCDRCREPVEATPDDLRKLGRPEDEARIIYRPVGCDACFGTGYAGRVGVFELLEVNDAIRDVVLGKPSLVSLKQALRGSGVRTLADHARERVLMGLTSLEDAERAVGLSG
ncbi:MAG: ATPase, T2SS/T4P/T4SS family [Planctomycetota bacterium]